MLNEKEALFKKASYIVDKINRKIREKGLNQEELGKKIGVTQSSVNQYLNLSKIYSSEKYYIRMLEALNFGENEINTIIKESRRIQRNAEFGDLQLDNENNEEIKNFLKMSREEQRQYFLKQIALSVKGINRDAFIKDLDSTIDFFINKYK